MHVCNICIRMYVEDGRGTCKRNVIPSDVRMYAGMRPAAVIGNSVNHVSMQAHMHARRMDLYLSLYVCMYAARRVMYMCMNARVSLSAPSKVLTLHQIQAGSAQIV